jgi:hypothetical protein
MLLLKSYYAIKMYVLFVILILFGKTLETKAYNHLSGSVSFNTNTLANGTYFVNLVSNGKLLSTQKIIIQH